MLFTNPNLWNSSLAAPLYDIVAKIGVVINRYILILHAFGIKQLPSSNAVWAESCAVYDDFI